MSELREEFLREAPEAPSTHGWADRVRSKHRRRRMAGSAVALGIVVALAVPLGISVVGRTGEPVVPAEPAPAPATFPVTTAAEVCDPYAPIHDVSDTDMPAVDELPDDTARVWLCPDGTELTTVAFPPEPLTDEDAVSTAIEMFNGLEQADLASIMCTQEMGMTYIAVFEYADGERIPVRGELFGCRFLVTGPNDDQTVRLGSQEYLEELTGLWADQRAETGEATPMGPEACDYGNVTLVPSQPDRVSGGFACIVGPDSTGPAVEIADDLARRLAALDFNDYPEMVEETDLRIALVDDVGGNKQLAYDGRVLLDETTWMGVEVPDDTRAELDTIRDELLG